MSDAATNVLKELGWQLLPAPRSAADVNSDLGADVPDQLRDIYRICDGGYAGNEVCVFDLASAREQNAEYRTDVPMGFFFADDGGSGFFFVNLDEALAPRGSVLWNERGWRIPADSVICAASVVGFLRAAARGEKPWTGTSIRNGRIDRMARVLDSDRSRWTASGAASHEQILDAMRATGQFPRELAHLLRIANGLTIPAIGVRLRDVDGIEPVPDTTDDEGRIGAFWFGKDATGYRFVVTNSYWREPDGGQVVRAAPGQSPQEAPIIGPLADVVVSWLKADEDREDG